MKEIGVGLLGLGNVGAGVVKLLADNAKAIEARLGARVVVRGIAVREVDKQRAVSVPESVVTDNWRAVIDRDDVEIVCELMGGTRDARDAVLRAIGARKQVVTANKALLAEHGDEVFAAAEEGNVDLYYEAAVCGGVPIIRALREGLASDRIESIHGIVNGTSNYILTRMAAEGSAFAGILADAQANGYAEADPTLDVSGGDAAHKLAILVSLCFGTRLELSSIYVEGIDALDEYDFAYARRFGFVIKPLVIAREHADGIEARVHPALVPDEWLLAGVPGAKNALYVRSYALGSSLYYGAGAGMMPTAMAVVSDIIEVARNVQAGSSGALPLRSYQRMTERAVRTMDQLVSRYYLRFGVVDKPGVMGHLTTILGEHNVSIEQVVQETSQRPELGVPVIILSHEAREGDVRRALAAIDQRPECVTPTRIIRVAS